MVDIFIVGQIATSCMSWQDYGNTPSSVWKGTLRFLVWYWSYVKRWRTNTHRSPIHMTFGEKWRTSFRNHEIHYNFKIRGTVIVKYMTFFNLCEIYRTDKMCLFYGMFAGQFDLRSIAPPHCVFRFRSNSCDFWCW